MNNQYANDFTKTVQLYYDDLKKYKPLTKAREKRFLRLAKKGNLKAKNKILESNLKFVFDVAKRYTGRGVPISELISEGNMGLLRAIDKFDEEKDVKFISYAIWWIRQYMLEIIKKKKIINIVEVENTETKNSVLETTMLDEEDDVVNSNEKDFSNENEELKKEVVKTQKDIIASLLKELDEREKEIIENYYGINDKKELTLAEIGEKFSLSSERVRQINKNSIKKMRSKMMLLNVQEALF